MTELEFNEALNGIIEEDDAFSCETAANCLMAYATLQHRLSVAQAKARQDTRADNRYTRSLRRAVVLDAAVMAASVVGIAVATWFLTSIAVL